MSDIQLILTSGKKQERTYITPDASFTIKKRFHSYPSTQYSFYVYDTSMPMRTAKGFDTLRGAREYIARKYKEII